MSERTPVLGTYLGIEVRTSPYLGGGEKGFPDWRERLERWLAPIARIPVREPLTKRLPDAILLSPDGDPGKSVAVFGLAAFERLKQYAPDLTHSDSERIL